MKRGFFIALLTAFAFGAGFFANQWMERHRPLPPPPGPFGWEFSHSRSGGRFGEPRRDRPLNRTELRARIAELNPQIEEFRARLAAIDADFGRELDKILTPEQRKQHSEHMGKVQDNRSAEEKAPKPVSDDQISYMLRDRPAQTILWDVVIPFRLDMLTRTCKLDDSQREQVRALLKTRRDKVLELIDSSPPPSVMLARIAPWVERFVQPPPPPPNSPPPPSPK